MLDGDPTDVDVLVVGAGPAGLSAALVLGRVNRDTLLCGVGPARNAPAAASHGLLSRDRTPPADLLAEGLAQLRPYPSVAVRHHEITTIAHHGDRFVADAGTDRAVAARAVILATGVVDELPALPGLAELWGHRVHHCPYCDGFEYTGKRLAVLGSDALAAAEAVLLRDRFTRHVTLVADRPLDLDEEACAHLERCGVAVATAPALAVASEGGALAVRLDGAPPVWVDGLFVATERRPRTELAAQLGCERRPTGHVVIDGAHRTSVHQVWAAGDATWLDGQHAPAEQLVLAAAGGARAAMDCNHRLVDLDHDLGGLRGGGPAAPGTSGAPGTPADPRG